VSIDTEVPATASPAPPAITETVPEPVSESTNSLRGHSLYRSKSHRCTSSCVPVFVDESIEDTGASQPAGVAFLRTVRLLMRFGWSLFSGLVRSVLVVVSLVLGEHLARVCLIEDQDVVADLVAEGSDDSFAVGVHPRCLRCAGQDVHVVGSEDSVEGGRILRVTVAEQEAVRAQPRTGIGGEVAGLLCRPVLRRVGSDAGDVEPSCAVLKKYQGTEAFAERCVDVEEVRGENAASLVDQELFPRGTGSTWGWIDPGRVQDLPHSRRGDPMPESDQFALDPSVSPARVFASQIKDELLDRRASGWPPGRASACAVVPLPGDESAMPGQDRRGLNREDVAPAAAGEQRGQRGEPETISRLVPDLTGDLAPQYGVLVPEHEQFGVFGGVTVQQHRGDGQQSSGQVIQQ
jgi:hypothetical protein